MMRLLMAMLCLGSGALCRAATDVRVARYYGGCRAAVSYTFDDGLLEHYTVLFPELRRRGLKGTFGVIGSKVGRDMKGTPCMTWAQMREMAADGQEIANHGWGHLAVTGLSAGALRSEVERNDTAIYNNVGAFPRTFFYPGNRKSDAAVAFCSRNRAGTRLFQVSVGAKRDSAWLRRWVDGLLERGEWGVGMTHGITTGYDAIGCPLRFWQHLDYVCTLRDSLWVAPLGDVAAYVDGRDNVRLKVRRRGRRLFVTPVVTPGKRLFCHRLTLEVDSDEPLAATQDGTALSVTRRGGAAFVDFNPCGGRIEIREKAGE